MKKIINVLILALAVSLAFTGCASKKAKEKGPKTYRIDIGSVIGSSLDVGEVTELNVSSLFPADKLPVAGDTVRVMWSMILMNYSTMAYWYFTMKSFMAI